MNLFDKINRAIEDAEGSIITLVTTLIPWLAPALPAWLTYSHLSEMGIPFAVSVAMAACIEGLGLAAVSTAFSAMRHNKQHRAEIRRVSLAFPVLAYLFYITVVIVVNVVLSLPLTETAREYAQVGAIALLTLISAPAFVIAVARNDQRIVDREWQERRQGKLSSTMLVVKKNASSNASSIVEYDYHCSICDEHFPSKQAYGAHQRWKHGNGHGEPEKITEKST